MAWTKGTVIHIENFVNLYILNSIEMTVAIQGIFQNGQVILNYQPKFKTKKKVTVLFESDSEINKKRIFGTLKGKITVPDNFNDPLDDLKEYMY